MRFMVLVEAEDFAPALTPELRKTEERIREKLAAIHAT